MPRPSPRRSPRRSRNRSTASRTCSTCRASRPTTGNLNLTVTFKVGTNLDVAQVQVQNRVAIALPQLPSEVQQQGVIVKKASPDITLAIAFFSPDGIARRAVPQQLRDLQVKDQIARLPGVGDINMFGVRDYSMRLWLNPDQLAVRRSDRGRRRQRGAGAEHPGCRRDRRRPAAPRREVRLPIHRERAGPADRSGAVRRNRRQGRQRRPHHAAEGCRAGSNWGRRITARP